MSDSVSLPQDLAAALFAVYDVWQNKIGTYDPGRDLVSDGVPITGIACLVDSEDSALMEEACDAVEPHEAVLRRLIAQ